MALTQNEALRNALSAAWGERFDGGTLEIRTSGGTTLLATITLPTPAFGSPSTGSVAKSGVWQATGVDVPGGGNAAVGRLISSDTTEVAEVSVGLSGTDMIIDDVAIVSGATVTITTFTYTSPAS
jgi:hypothetical protein